jgi:CRP-like cAMP-binding protein
MTSKIAGNTLAKSPVFSVLSPARRKDLAEAGRSVALTRGKKLFARGDAADAAYAIITGELEVTIEGLDGRPVFIAHLGAGDVVGELGVLDGVARSTDVIATRKTELWRIDRAHVLDALTNEPESALALLGILARRIRDTDALVDRNASMEMGKRLARLLLDESTHGRIIYTQSDLAHLIGATREAVNRKLGRWRKEKWIELNHTGLHVIDRPALLALCRRKASI